MNGRDINAWRQTLETQSSLATCGVGEAFNTLGAFDGPMAVDPVCGKPVNPHNAYWMIWYRGTPYYFCTEDCQLKFDRKPEHFRQLVLDRRQNEAVY
jgi:YHS domain-containing protein